MDFPPIDEPTALAINEVIDRCENAQRLFETALKTVDDESMRPLLRRGVDAHAQIVADLRQGMLDTAGEASRGGTMKGLVRRLRESVGQRTGWRERRHLVNALIDQLQRTLAAFDDAINHISDARFRTMLADRRSVVAAQVPPLEAVVARD